MTATRVRRNEHRSLARAKRQLQFVRAVFPILERLGLHLTLNRFDEPVPDVRSLPDELFARHSELPGIDMREAEQLGLLERIVDLKEEYSNWPFLPADDQSPYAYFQRNEQFERVDAEVLYAMIRLNKPRRMIEIGAGYSTLVATEAIARNMTESGEHRCELIGIDPYPRGFLRGLPGHQLVEERVQDLPLDLFSELTAGDILLIDSSHALKIGSDVQYEFLELLPRIAPGVLVHVHDIFFPTDYPRLWVRDWLRFFTEQYLLQAFLAFNDSFPMRWSGSWMTHRHPEKIRDAFPSFDRGGWWPSSVWIERR